MQTTRNLGRIAQLVIFNTFFTSCFTVGLPEPVCDLSNQIPQTPSKVLIIEDKQLNSASNTLGSQYLLGFIPLTNIFLQRGESNFILEILLQHLLSKGFDVILAAPQTGPQSKEILRIIQPKISVSGYDLLFFRNLVVESQFELEGVELYWSRQNRFQKSADLSSLSFLLERNITQSLRDKHIELPNTSPSFFNILISPPQTPLTLDNLEAADSIGAMLSSSYNSPGYPSYNHGQIARIIQRGFHRALVASKFSGGSSSRVFSNSPYPQLVSKVEELAIKDGELSIAISLYLSFQGKKHYPALCSTKAIDNTSVDGSLVQTLEIASEQIFSNYFKKECEPT